MTIAAVDWACEPNKKLSAVVVRLDTRYQPRLGMNFSLCPSVTSGFEDAHFNLDTIAVIVSEGLIKQAGLLAATKEMPPTFSWLSVARDSSYNPVLDAARGHRLRSY